jgi:DNA-binding MarR family transcriptional regulator
MHPDNSAGKLFVSLSFLNTKLLKRIDNELSVHGISFTEYLILQRLDEARDQTMRRIELARRVGISASGVTRLLAPMEKLRLVEKERNPRDARMRLVKLSPGGQSIFEEASVTFFESSRSIFEPLTPAQLKKMTNLIDLLH